MAQKDERSFIWTCDFCEFTIDETDPVKLQEKIEAHIKTHQPLFEIAEKGKERKMSEEVRARTPNLDKLGRLAEQDVIEVYGGSGTGKTKLSFSLALEAKSAGIPLIYLDTERNLTQAEIQSIGAGYHYLRYISEIDDFIKKIPKAKLFILDSAGYPALTQWSRLPFDQRMLALVKMINWFDTIKSWCQENQALAVITNQPESVFVQERAGREIPEPFGDKSIYASKEVIYLKRLESKGEVTRILGSLYRSRKYPPMHPIFELQISKEVKISWKI